MTKKLIAAALTLGMFSLLTAEVMDDNGRAGYTGAPGENNCTYSGCHTGNALNNPGGSIELRTGTTNNVYVPGQTYNMQFKVAFTGRSLFGLGVEALDASGNNAGTLTANASFGNQIKTRTVGAYTRRCIVHTFNGGARQDSMVFRFTWTAPQSGTVTFYYCGNAANGNASESGDYIYTGSTVLNPFSTTGIAEKAGNMGLSVYPNPAQGSCSIQLNGTMKTDVSLQLFDMGGKLIRQEAVVPGGAENTVVWNELEALPRGTYLLSAKSGDSHAVNRIILQ
ncbi:MAG: hypothetical protein RL213_1034 [Bacteroidota bacterium]|jgi:hypothetical protein